MSGVTYNKCSCYLFDTLDEIKPKEYENNGKDSNLSHFKRLPRHHAHTVSSSNTDRGILQADTSSQEIQKVTKVLISDGKTKEYECLCPHF